ncbi:hypothetical protein BC835DRAFT_1509303 [Cytidiella melzeri]|nr:hypothetical protein BC835DRAFT_1509303 [Cytidiella melzeri]
MISLSPGSLCDVCAEEYGPHNYPHSLPCGHILCLSCCNNIIEKTSQRLTPCCPFCRESFTSHDIRLIRMDFTPTSSGWSTPKGGAGVHEVIIESDGEDALSAGLKSREQAKRLEYKVARVAAKKCSVEEVSMLHKELQEWLQSKVKPREQASSLELSAALLRAILVNHLAHSEATKAHRNIEAQLTSRLEDTEMAKGKLESELRNLPKLIHFTQRAEYSHTAQENQSLRAELNRYKVKSSAPPLSPPRSHSTMPTSPSSDPRSRATSPTSPTPYSRAPPLHSPLAARVAAANPVHSRSASAQLPTTGLRSTTPSIRSGTPASPMRDLRSRRTSVSTPSPLKMARSTSSGSSADEILIQKDRAQESDRQRQQEKDAKRVQLIQRWIPNLESTSPPTTRSGYLHNPPHVARAPSVPPTSRSRTISAASAALAMPLRHKTPLPANLM